MKSTSVLFWLGRLIVAILGVISILFTVLKGVILIVPFTILMYFYFRTGNKSVSY